MSEKIRLFLRNLLIFLGSQDTQLLQFFPGKRFETLSPVFSRK